MAEINVQPTSEGEPWTFQVTVSEGGSRSSHRVTLTGDAYKRLAGEACGPDELVRKSFEFLLEREPKESILGEFDITVIGRYFPEYEGEIAERIRS